MARLGACGYTPAMLPVLAVGALALAAIALALLRSRDAGDRLRSGPATSAPSRPEGGRKSAAAPRPGSCALCGTTLAPGESMKSDILPGEGDRLMRIFGCPHCLGAKDLRKPRFCPVCERELGPGDHAIARLFERPGRKHVHVLGCTLCRGSASGGNRGR